MKAVDPGIVRATGAVPLLGHIPPLWHDALGFLQRQHGSHGIVELRLGRRHPVYLLTRADLVHQVLSDSHRYDKGGPIFEAARHEFGNGLATCAHRDHRRQRRLLQPAFHRAQLDGYAAVIRSCITQVCDSWQEGRAVDIDREAYRMAGIVSTSTLSMGGADATIELVRSLPILLGGMYRRTIVPAPWLHRLPLPANRAYDRAATRVHGAVEQAIRDCRRSGGDPRSLLTVIVGARDETGHGLGEDEMHDQVMTILGSGFETTGSTLGWALHELAQHPDCESAVRAELATQLGGRAVTVDDVSRLSCLNRVVTEVLRLYPAGAVITRVTTEPVLLDGHRLPAGSDVLFSPYCLHRSPDIFSEPDRFDPDRWLPERRTDEQRHAYLPFGLGARRCIGDRFATLELTIALAVVLGRWRLRQQPGTTVRPVFRFTLRPSGLRMIPSCTS